jgi:hypothetical protein
MPQKLAETKIVWKFKDYWMKSQTEESSKCSIIRCRGFVRSLRLFELFISNI